MKRTVDNIKDPLYRFFEREVNLGSRLLADVRADLDQVAAVCAGKQKQSNYLRTLTTALNKGIVPERWRRYTVPDVTVIQWIQDMAERMMQLQRIADIVIKEQAKGLKVCVCSILLLMTMNVFIEDERLVRRIVYRRSIYYGNTTIGGTSECMVIRRVNVADYDRRRTNETRRL